MGSGPSQTTNQSQVQSGTQSGSGSQTAQLSPWAPVSGGLTAAGTAASGLGTAVTPQQSAAISNLGGILSNLPNFAPQTTGAVSNLFNATTLPQQGILGSAYGTYQGQLAPIVDPNNLNPMNTPGFSTALGSTEQQITNAVNEAAAAAGVNPSSPAYAKALSQGLVSGVAPTIAQQYNTNVGNLMGAAGAEFGAGGTTATGLTAQQQQTLQDQINAMSAAGQLPGILSTGAQAQLQAANLGYQLPYSNIATATGVLSPLAQTFGTQAGTGTYQGQNYGTGSSTSTTTQSNPLMNQVLGGALMGLSLLPK